MSRPTLAMINLDALRHNYSLAQKLSSNGKVIAVVKADAYGHGLLKCVKALADIASGFAVRSIDEAIVLREAGIKQVILLLEGFFDTIELPIIDKYHLDLVIHHQYQVDALFSHPFENAMRLWLKMDTGMGRLGFAPKQYRTVWQQINNHPFVKDIIIMSHLACADELGSLHVKQQLETFETFTKDLPGDRSFCNSAGLIAVNEARGSWNRPGILLYGVSPFRVPHEIDQKIKPVMELSTEIISIKEIEPGSTVGYGGLWMAQRVTRVGVIAIGYADGYPRHAPSGTPIMINGKRVPVIGNVSMDMLTVDLTDLPSAKIGDRAILWGDSLAVSEVAKKANTVPNQLLTNLNRVRIQYQSNAVTDSLDVNKTLETIDR